ncbi:Cell cycle control protein 50A [Heterocephalus glaber]|uniref:Cell cycle control protein 50A n=1 Tax=Heterocephalus glaber TaxID=10181 RepID=G5AN97_HETGA|nr:Cell cycle control protein 50A [Heterocephalus glaber]
MSVYQRSGSFTFKPYPCSWFCVSLWSQVTLWVPPITLLGVVAARELMSVSTPVEMLLEGETPDCFCKDKYSGKPMSTFQTCPMGTQPPVSRQGPQITGDKTAFPVLHPHMILKSGVILSPSVVLHPLPPDPVPVHQLHWEPPPPSFGNAPLPQGNPLVLSLFPMTPVVAGHGGCGQTGARPFNITAQARRARRPAVSLLIQSTVLTQVPLMRGAQGSSIQGKGSGRQLILSNYRPVLRSLSLRRPAMSVEKGLQIGVHEWDPTSKYKCMTFYEVAEEFMEFEAAEKMERLRLQLTGGLPGCPIPAPLRPEAPRPPVPKVVQQPGRQTLRHRLPAPQDPNASSHLRPWHLMRSLLKPWRSWTGWKKIISCPLGSLKKIRKRSSSGKRRSYAQALDILSYIDELCSQEDFVTKVEAIINLQFLEEVGSTDVETDSILAVEEVLEEVLEVEHILTLDELVEKRLLGSKAKGGVCRPQSPSAPRSAVHQGAEQDDHDPKLRVNKKTCPTPKASQVCKRYRDTDEELPGPEVPAVLRRRHHPAPLRASGPSALPQDLTPRGALSFRGASPTGVPCEPASSLGEDDGDISSLSFLLVSPRQLLNWAWPPTPEPGMGLPCPEGPAPQALPPQGGSLSPDLPPSARSKKRVLTGGGASGLPLPVTHVPPLPLRRWRRPLPESPQGLGLDPRAGRLSARPAPRGLMAMNCNAKDEVDGGPPCAPRGAAKTRRPHNTTFKQQRLPAWQPILTEGTVLPTFIIGLIYIPISISIFVTSNNVREIEIDYTGTEPSSPCNKCLSPDVTPCVCIINFTLEKAFEGNVFMYYGLSNFYQNHRRYVKSRDDSQLNGDSSA